MDNKVKEIKRILDSGVPSIRGNLRVNIDSVDYYDEDINMITTGGFIEIEPFVAYLETPQGNKILQEITSTIERVNNESDRTKLDAIIEFVPQMVDDGVWGVYLEL